MNNPSPSSPNVNRVLAGRRNRVLRGPLTEQGRRRLQEAALRNKPWLKATGPKTTAGKAKAAANGRQRQEVPSASIREMRAALSDVSEAVKDAAKLRSQLLARTGASDADLIGRQG